MSGKSSVHVMILALALGLILVAVAFAGPVREVPATHKTYERTCVGGRHITLTEVLLEESVRLPGGRLDWRPKCNKVTLTFRGKVHVVEACEPLSQDVPLAERADYWCAPGRLKKFGIR